MSRRKQQLEYEGTGTDQGAGIDLDHEVEGFTGRNHGNKRVWHPVLRPPLSCLLSFDGLLEWEVGTKMICVERMAVTE